MSTTRKPDTPVDPAIAPGPPSFLAVCAVLVALRDYVQVRLPYEAANLHPSAHALDDAVRTVIEAIQSKMESE